jgi:hypothetical protein
VTYVTMRVTFHLVTALSNVCQHPKSKAIGLIGWEMRGRHRRRERFQRAASKPLGARGPDKTTTREIGPLADAEPAMIARSSVNPMTQIKQHRSRYDIP